MEFYLRTHIPASAAQVYDTWLDSKGHSEMTGGKAVISNKNNEMFTAWDGYISGQNLELEPGKKIVQSWRTTEFKEEDENSMIEIYLKDTDVGCELTLEHTNVPEDGHSYKKGWQEHYFEPMKEYFKNLNS